MEYINRLLHRKSPNTSTCSSPELTVNDNIPKVPAEHEVKVKFAREFGDVVNYPPPLLPPTTSSSTNVDTNTISSTNSLQSLTSTLNTKSSSDICAHSPIKSSDISCTNFDVSGLDDLISGCAKININDTPVKTIEQSFADATFTSATDDLNLTQNLSRPVSPNLQFNSTQVIENNPNITEVICERMYIDGNSTEIIDNNYQQDIDLKVTPEQQISPEYASACETFLQSNCDIEIDSEELNNTFACSLPSQDFIPPIESQPAVSQTNILTEENDQQQQNQQEQHQDSNNDSVEQQTSLLPSPSGILLKAESALETSSTNIENPELLQTPVDSIQIPPTESLISENLFQSIPNIYTNDLESIKQPTFFETQNNLNITKSLLAEPNAQSDTVNKDCEISIEQLKLKLNETSSEATEHQSISNNICNQLDLSVAAKAEDIQKVELLFTDTEGQCIKDLDSTVNINDISTNTFDTTEVEHQQENVIISQNENTNVETIPTAQEEYKSFIPQRQSTSLNDLLPIPPSLPESNVEHSPVKCSVISDSEYYDIENTSIIEQKIDYNNLQEENINTDICNTSVELVDDNECHISDKIDVWRDPSNFDFLLSKKTDIKTTDRLRTESLYIKFDPLVSDTNMLPQGNGATATPNEETNGEKEVSEPNNVTPKRNPAIAAIDRLLFYSPMTPVNQKNEEPKKIEPTEKTTPEPTPVVDTIMAKELELVRATVLQLEEQLEKQKKEQEEQAKEHKIDCEAFQEAIAQLQEQLNQEIKSKNQINVVVDEYEKSISRLVAGRERDRKNLDAEKASLLKELQEVKDHLSASESAFNDVHAKYERLKVVVTASKNNELALKASIAENVEIIKNLEDRYDQIKTHAAMRLEKANLELESIRKQHESETLKLRAMLRKEELKSNSLAETIEQKTKENKELTKILDEVIARVDPGADK